MQRTMLKSKIHRATVTEANLDYDGSITIDRALMRAADIWPFERVEVYNVDNGARFATYAIEGKENSSTICINGAAAHLAKPGHKVIICSYVAMAEEDIPKYKQRVVLVDSKNKMRSS
ncbi:MAG: aspartate 1-decarboxylase [Bacteriovoracia bacterium]